MLRNTVVLLMFLLRKVRLAFLDVIFSVLNFFKRSHSEIRLLLSRLLAQACSTPMLYKSRSYWAWIVSKSQFANWPPKSSTQRDKEKGNSNEMPKARLSLMP